MGRLIKLVLLVALLVGAYVVAQPYLTVQKLTQALENEDTAAVDQYVDFDAVRASFQDDFPKRLGIAQPESENFGAVMASGIIGAFLQGIVSPESMVLVLKDKSRRDRMGLTTNMADLMMNGSWHDAGNFVLYNADGKPTTLLTRKGMRWEVSGISIR